MEYLQIAVEKCRTSNVECLLFNAIPLKDSISQKHIGLTLHVMPNFVKHIRISIKKQRS